MRVATLTVTGCARLSFFLIIYIPSKGVESRRDCVHHVRSLRTSREEEYLRSLDLQRSGLHMGGLECRRLRAVGGRYPDGAGELCAGPRRLPGWPRGAGGISRDIAQHRELFPSSSVPAHRD